MKYSFTVIALTVVTACVSTSVWGTLVQVVHQDTAGCDTLLVPTNVDEIARRELSTRRADPRH